MRRVGILSAVVFMVSIAGLIGCSSTSPSAQPSQASGKVVVFAAASLKPAFTQIGQQFKAQNPGLGVDFALAALGELMLEALQFLAA